MTDINRRVLPLYVFRQSKNRGVPGRPAFPMTYDLSTHSHPSFNSSFTPAPSCSSWLLNTNQLLIFSHWTFPFAFLPPIHSNSFPRFPCSLHLPSVQNLYALDSILLSGSPACSNSKESILISISTLYFLIVPRVTQCLHLESLCLPEPISLLLIKFTIRAPMPQPKPSCSWLHSQEALLPWPSSPGPPAPLVPTEIPTVWKENGPGAVRHPDPWDRRQNRQQVLHHKESTFIDFPWVQGLCRRQAFVFIFSHVQVCGFFSLNLCYSHLNRIGLWVEGKDHPLSAFCV